MSLNRSRCFLLFLYVAALLPWTSTGFSTLFDTRLSHFPRYLAALQPTGGFRKTSRDSGVQSGSRRCGILASTGACAARMLVSPIAGASVSVDGFVVLLEYKVLGTYFEEDKYIPVVVSCADTEVVKSPEALTILQLMQGIDMATPLLPPDALQKAYGDMIQAALSEVHVYPPEDLLIGRTRPGKDAAKRGGDADLFAGKTLEMSDDQWQRRESKLQERAPDLVKALKTVNVIVDLNRAVDLLRTYSSVEGDLDRNGFSDALAAARVPINLKPPGSMPTFTLVAVTEDSVGKEVNVSAFVGLSLHLRHKAPIVVKGGRRAPGVQQVRLCGLYL